MGATVPFAITLLITAFAPMIEGGTTHAPVFVLRALVLVLLVSYLVPGLKQRNLAFYRTAFDPAVAALLAVALISVFIAPYRYMALTWVQLIFYYALFFYLARCTVTGERIGAVVVTFMSLGVFEAGVALVQWYTAGGRANGTFFNPNMLADYLLPSLILSFSLLIFRHRWARGARAAGLAAVAALCLAVVVLTGSRGGALAAIAGLFVVLWVRKRTLAVAALILLAASVLFIPNPVRDRFRSGEPFAYSRSDIWKSSAKMAMDHPLGVGLGNFKYYWPRYNFPVKDAVIKYGKLANTAHNEYLHTWAEMGVQGILVLLFGVFLLGRAAAACVKNAGGDTGLAAGLAGGLTAFLLHASVDSNMHEPGIMFLVILLACTLLAITPGEEKRRVTLELDGRQARRSGLLLGALVLVMFAWALTPALGHYYSQMGAKAIKAGDLDAALSYLDRAIIVEPSNASHQNTRASALYAAYNRAGEKKQFEEALSGLDEAARLNPADATNFALKALVEYVYASSLKDDGERRQALTAALSDFERARALEPYDYGNLDTGARIYVALSDTDKAQATLIELVRLEPNYRTGRLILAGLYMRQGRADLAKRECYTIIETGRKFEGVQLTSQERGFLRVDMKKVGEILGDKEVPAS